MATKKTAKINMYDTYAHIQFNFRTSAELKERIKKYAWIKWKKSDVNGKTFWYLNCDLNSKDGEDRNAEMLAILSDFEIEPILKFEGEDEFSENFEAVEKLTGKEDVTKERAQPFRVYMKPSLYKVLSGLAEEKHMSFSQFIILATDYYIKENKIDIPLKTMGESLFDADLTKSDQIRMAMFRMRTKPAWVADKLGYSRSSFYSKLEKNMWTEDELSELSKLLKTKII